MTSTPSLTRRSFLAMTAAAPLALAAQTANRVPIGLELYSVRDELARGLTGTVRAVAKMGYQVVEFFSPYYQWTPEYAKEVRKLLDDLGIRCPSTHNSSNALAPEGIQKAIDLNQILGTRYIVMASPGRVTEPDGWKGVADRLSQASEKLKPVNIARAFTTTNPNFCQSMVSVLWMSSRQTLQRM